MYHLFITTIKIKPYPTSDFFSKFTPELHYTHNIHYNRKMPQCLRGQYINGVDIS